MQKEGWRQQMNEIRAVRTVAQLLVALSRSQKWRQKPAPKTGPQYCRKKERLPKWRPHFWDQGVAYTVSPPLRAVSSGDSGTCRLFSGNGLDKASSKFHSIYIYITQNRLVVLHATHQSSSHAVWFQDANPTARSMRPMIPRNLG